MFQYRKYFCIVFLQYFFLVVLKKSISLIILFCIIILIQKDWQKKVKDFISEIYHRLHKLGTDHGHQFFQNAAAIEQFCSNAEKQARFEYTPRPRNRPSFQLYVPDFCSTVALILQLQNALFPASEHTSSVSTAAAAGNLDE